MKTLTALCLILALTPAPFAQTAPARERPDGLRFSVTPRWRKNYLHTPTYTTPRDREGAQATAMEREVAHNHADVGNHGVVGLLVAVQNEGPKAVTLIRGRLLIIEDGREAAGLAFESRAKLRAGKAKVLAKFALTKLQQPVRERFLTDLSFGRAVARVRVERVEYEDGTT